jgi:uncharacterized protein (TIGR03118 family)
MRYSIHSVSQRFGFSRHERRSRRRRPQLEGLEQRSLLSVTHPIAVHHNDAMVEIKKPKGFFVTNLVENTSTPFDGSAPQLVEPALINPWGMSFSTTSPFWLSDAGTGISALYSVTQTNTVTQIAPPTPVAVPSASGGGSPTGQVFNGTSGFTIPPASGTTNVKSLFIFATLQGTIDGWNPASTGGLHNAVVAVNDPSASFTGLAMATNGGQTYLYAANNAASPGINVYNSSWAPVTLTGNFVDPKLKAGFTPYNIQLVNNQLYVTYRSLGSGGAVAEFNTDGTFVRQIAFNRRAGKLNAPWGVTIAPAGFGKFGGDLLVGNFGSGKIDVYSGTKFKGTLTNAKGKPLVIPDLWALDFGNGNTGGKAGLSSALYFTAGIDGQAGGLFGSIQPNGSTV